MMSRPSPLIVFSTNVFRTGQRRGHESAPRSCAFSESRHVAPVACCTPRLPKTSAVRPRAGLSSDATETATGRPASSRAGVHRWEERALVDLVPAEPPQGGRVLV